MSRRVALLAVLLLWLPLAGPARSAEPPPGEAPGAMALVLDASGSMAEPVSGGGGSRIDAAKESLRSVVESLPAEQDVSFRVYGSTDVAEDDPVACRDSERIVDLGADNRDELLAAIDDYEPVGWTPTGHALREAAEDLGDDGQRTIVLVSDGESTCDPDPCEVAEKLSEDGIELKIDVVGLDVDGAAREQLQCTAAAGNGTYYDVDSAAELTDSLTTSSTRAARPFDLTGTPVDGTPGLDGAPDLARGQYLDQLATSGEKHYRVTRTAPGSTLHVGVTLVGEGGSSGNGADLTIAPVLDTGDAGTTCDRSLAYQASIGRRDPVLYAAVNSSSAPGRPCRTADSFDVRLLPTNQEASGKPIEIAVYEEPPLADGVEETLPEAPEEPAWETLGVSDPTSGVVPGTSISNAPVVSDGTYALDITSGESQVLAIPLDWGQDVQAQLDASIPEEARRAGGIGSDLEVAFLGPMRDNGTVSFYGNEPDDWTTAALANLQEPDYRTGAQSQTVGYRHREEAGAIRGAAIPGLRYVKVSFDVQEDDVNLPYTLTLRTNGTAGEGAPEYAEVDGLQPPTADSALVTAAVVDEEPATDEPAGEPAEDGGGFPWLVVVLVAVGLLAAVSATVLVLLRRRRAG